MDPIAIDALEKVRQICMSISNVEERLSHGEPAWFIQGKRQFAMFANHHHDDRVAVWCAARPGVQEALIAEDPKHFFRPPYVGPRGWIGIYLDGNVDLEELDFLLREAYETVK